MSDELIEFEWVVRAAPPSETFPNGVPQEMRKALYTPDEVEYMRALSGMRRDALERERKARDEGSEAMASLARAEASALYNEAAFYHELKALLGAMPYEPPAETAESKSQGDWPCSYPHVLGWRKHPSGHLICAVCHQPAVESLVHEWVNRDIPSGGGGAPMRGLKLPTGEVPRALRGIAGAVSSPRAGKHHSNGHPTEIQAALSGLGRKGAQRRVVFERYIEAGSRGLIDEELQVAAGVSDKAHRTRRNELVTLGVVGDTGTTRLTETGNDSIVWSLTGLGRRVAELV